jgi:phosphoadenosine phosphosulfate reductase
MKAVTIGDHAHARLRGFQARVDRALSEISAAGSHGRIGISYSGGKDSTVLLDLVRRVYPDAPAAFFDSGCEYHWTYEIVKHYGVHVIKPEMSLPEMCRHGGYWGYKDPIEPGARFDFFAFLVSEPSQRFIRGFDLQVIAIGLRGEESAGRRMNARKHGAFYETRGGVHHLCPLAFWTHDDIWAYIASRGLRYNEVYDKMVECGIPRDRWRVSTLLGMCGAATMGRYAFLRQVDPEAFRKLSAEFPRIMSFT